MSIEKAAEAIVDKSHEHCATWITIEEARELARAALPHLMEEPTDVEIDEIALTTGTQGQLRSVSRAIYEFVRRRIAPPEPPKELRNEVEIGWITGFVTAGPFVRENVKWTPEQAEECADFLRKAAKSAREAAPPEPPPVKQDINSEEWVKSAYPNANCLYGEKSDTHFVLSSDRLLVLGSGESEGDAWANADSRLKSLPSIPQAAPPEPDPRREALNPPTTEETMGALATYENCLGQSATHISGATTKSSPEHRLDAMAQALGWIMVHRRHSEVK